MRFVKKSTKWHAIARRHTLARTAVVTVPATGRAAESPAKGGVENGIPLDRSADVAALAEDAAPFSHLGGNPSRFANLCGDCVD
jgi:hypothetical protein